MKLVLNLSLVIIAITLFVVLLPFGVLYGLGASFFKRKFKEGMTKISDYFLTIAISIDQMGNVFFKELFNDVLIRPSGHRFGNEDETISSVLGKNKLSHTLTSAGKALVWLLDKLDKNHSIKSME